MGFLDFFTQFKTYLKSTVDPSEERENESETIDSIMKSINFRGSNLWVLIFAIFIASLGLNVNSTAVIIGAMLISPLMGPIMGIGLGIGIYDFDLIKKASRNLAIATVFGIMASTVYFLISPLNEARSELLARTTPTIYDVLIAFFGGMAGIVASSTRLKGNVIPGVAIATALMPPLCTAGFGLASGNMSYFFGAFYLYTINSVFIAFATTLGVKFMHFSKKAYVQKGRKKKVQRIVAVILCLTLGPSIYITYHMVKNSIFEANATRFITEEVRFPSTIVVSRHVSKDSISVTLVGREIPQDYILMLKEKMHRYKLDGCKFTLIQGLDKNPEQEGSDAFNALVLKDFYKKMQTQLLEQTGQIKVLQKKLQDYADYDSLAVEIAPEIKVLFPEVKKLALTRMLSSNVADGEVEEVVMAMLECSPMPSDGIRERLRLWLATRTREEGIRLVISGKRDE